MQESTLQKLDVQETPEKQVYSEEEGVVSDVLDFLVREVLRLGAPDGQGHQEVLQWDSPVPEEKATLLEEVMAN
jgi:hypothetical protein